MNYPYVLVETQLHRVIMTSPDYCMLEANWGRNSMGEIMWRPWSTFDYDTNIGVKNLFITLAKKMENRQ